MDCHVLYMDVLACLCMVVRISSMKIWIARISVWMNIVWMYSVCQPANMNNTATEKQPFPMTILKYDISNNSELNEAFFSYQDWVAYGLPRSNLVALSMYRNSSKP